MFRNVDVLDQRHLFPVWKLVKRGCVDMLLAVVQIAYWYTLELRITTSQKEID